MYSLLQEPKDGHLVDCSQSFHHLGELDGFTALFESDREVRPPGLTSFKHLKVFYIFRYIVHCLETVVVLFNMAPTYFT
jgi:hypothetical protein